MGGGSHGGGIIIVALLKLWRELELRPGNFKNERPTVRQGMNYHLTIHHTYDEVIFLIQILR